MELLISYLHTPYVFMALYLVKCRNTSFLHFKTENFNRILYGLVTILNSKYEAYVNMELVMLFKW